MVEQFVVEIVYKAIYLNGYNGYDYPGYIQPEGIYSQNHENNGVFHHSMVDADRNVKAL